MEASWLKSSERYLLQEKKRQTLNACTVPKLLQAVQGFLNTEQQIPTLRMLHAPFIKMASLLSCRRTNGMGGSAVPGGVVSRAPGSTQTGCLRGALRAAMVCCRSS